MAGKFILKVDGTKVSEERGIDLVAGTNVTLTTTYTEAGHEAASVEIAASGASGAPSTVDYLVGTADAGLSAEIVVGTTPGGELGGTWASPTVDATHSGSAHHAQSHGNADHTSTFITATGVTFENLDANADVGSAATQVAQGDHTHAGAGHTIQDDDASLTQRANLSFQDGFVVADDAVGNQTELDLSYEVTPSTQAFGDAAAPGTAITVTRGDHKHAMPADPVTAHEAAGDPHTGYRLESADHTHQSTGAQAGQLDHGLALTGLTDDDHTQYLLLAGRSGGQTVYGGIDANNDLTLEGTSHATKTTSYVLLQPSGGKVGVGTATPGQLLHVVGNSGVVQVR